jgi:serine/threonine protein kinase
MYCRDLKTGNCLVTQQGNIKVTDFGSIAKNLQQTVDQSALGQAHSSADAATSSLTSGVGTPLYMAPEIIRGDNYDASADVFSYGCVLWEIAAQREPDILHENLGTVKLRGPFLSQLLKMWEQGATLAPDNGWHVLYRELIPQCLQLKASVRPAFEDLILRF